MIIKEIYETAIEPALALLPERMTSKKALVMLIAIGLQESRLTERRQLVGNPPRSVGPAKSLWQAEQGGGMVHGVRTHRAVSGYAGELYAARGVEASNSAIWDAIEHDDVLAAGLARLLLWTDPKELPELGDEQAAWDLYLRTWRPGKPHRHTWPALYKQALEFVEALE